MNHRKILHIDMDAFFASVEQRDNPDLRGKPIAVGGGDRGVVAAASYEARKFGVYSAMPSVTAKRKCPNLIFVRHRFDVYKKASRQIREVFAKYSNHIQPLSLDEAFLDITENIANHSSAKETALAIKKDIFETTGLTASAGVSFNKFLAKIASDINKPNGIYVITLEKAPAFLDALPIGKFFGIGKVTEKKMKARGIHFGKDLRPFDKFEMAKRFGKSGRYYYNMINLLDERPVKHVTKRKSIGTERTFNTDIESFGIAAMHISNLTKRLMKTFKKTDDRVKTITIKIKYEDFVLKTRSKTIKNYTKSERKIIAVAKDLLKQDELIKPIRLLGVSLSNFESEKIFSSKQTTFDF
ncbi:MAG: DNA polymerase IV [Chitinophagales bacterium]